MMFDLIVLGGGAAGIFSALHAKSAHPLKKVLVLEKSAKLLSKVRVSGGGRCNVTHACFDPKGLIQHYPRGGEELIGPFHRFQPKDTVQWFTSRGVKLKTEADGRMFPTTDHSETIIQCLLSEARNLGVEIHTVKNVERIEKRESFTLYLKDRVLTTKTLLLATGSSPQGYAFAKIFGHAIVPTVPSLFTFNVPTSLLHPLSGLSVDRVGLSIAGHSQTGPLLITHFGFSGPAVIKLSAWAARELYEKKYQDTLFINWIPEHSPEKLLSLKESSPHKLVSSECPFPLPKALWKLFTQGMGKWKDTPNRMLRSLGETLKRDPYQVDGKTTHKEEFVTCGGIHLAEVNFKTMESKLCPGLYFAGEILNIDGITGGFNFQNAWTTGYIAGSENKL